MRSPVPISIIVAVALVGAACGGEGVAGSGGDEGGVVVLAKAEGWRDGLQESAGHPYALVEIAADAETAARAWDDNVAESLPEADGEPSEPGVYHALETVDFDRQAVVVFSSGESGSCPAWVGELSTGDGRVDVGLRSTAGEAEACTDDFNPYRLVLAVDRDDVPSSDELPVERVDVPSENLTDVEGRVVSYPVD